jgi:hypothetical protein
MGGAGGHRALEFRETKMAITRRNALLASAMAITMPKRGRAEETIKIGLLANMGGRCASRGN